MSAPRLDLAPRDRSPVGLREVEEIADATEDLGARIVDMVESREKMAEHVRHGLFEVRHKVRKERGLRKAHELDDGTRDPFRVVSLVVRPRASATSDVVERLGARAHR